MTHGVPSINESRCPNECGFVVYYNDANRTTEDFISTAVGELDMVCGVLVHLEIS